MEHHELFFWSPLELAQSVNVKIRMYRKKMNAMDYEINYPELNMAEITFTVSKADFEKALEEAKETTKSEDPAVLREFAISSFASKVLTEAVDTNKLKLAYTPALMGTDDADGNVTITINCPLLPEVKLGQYKGLNVTKDAVDVPEEEVIAEMNRQISAQKLWETLPEGTKAEEGDQVIIDFVGEKDGVPFDGGSGENFPLILGSHSFIPGFEEQLIGSTAGEKVKVDVTFPENYFEPSLAGQPVVFMCTVKDVQKEIKPELTNEFLAKMKLEGIHSVDDFKNRLAIDLKALKEQEAENKAISTILEKVADGSEVDIPDAMIDNQVEQYVNEYENNMKQYGMTLDQYLQFSGQTLDAFKQQLRPQAILTLRQALVLEAIAEKEAIIAEDKEIEDEYALLSQMYSFPAEQLKAIIPYGTVATQLVQRKTMDFLKDQNLAK